MKKNLILSAMAFAALAFVGCSKDEVVSESPTLNNAIEFGTYLGRSANTRGKETNTTTIQGTTEGGGGFGVLAYYTGSSEFASAAYATPNFMYNQSVTYENTASKWTYNPVKYWPTTSGDKISFFAYAPYSTQGETSANGISLSTNTETGTPTVTFTIADTADKMVDFVADAAYNKTWQKDASSDNADDDTNGVSESEVKFNLLHELTRVSFKAKVNEALALEGENATSTTRVAITSIELNSGEGTKFYKSAKYTFPADDESSIGTWGYDNSDATKVNEAYNIASVLDLKSLNNSGFSLPTNNSFNADMASYTAVWLNPVEDTATSIFKGGSTTDNTSDDEYLFLIPPCGIIGVTTATNTTAPMSITVSYDIITADGNLSKGYSITSATKTVSLGGTTETPLLKQGCSYVYTLIFGIDEIQVSAEVTGWGDTNNDNVNVDYEDTDVTASADTDGGGDA